MAKIAMVTDTHAGVRNDNQAFHEYQKTCFNWFFDYLDKNEIKTVIHLGDMFDRRKYINFVTARRIREDVLEPLEARGIETHIIQGNHDSYFKDTHEVNALDELISGRYRFIHTYSVPTILHIDSLPIQIMPWITDSNRDAAIEAISKPKAEVMMGHLEIKDFLMFKGAMAEHGQDITMFDKFDKVYSGHYHHRSTKRNVTYIGALMEYVWTDYEDPRGFSVFDTETRELEFIQNPHKMFKAMVYDDLKDTNILEKIKKTDFSQYSKKYVKIVCANKTNPYAFDLLFDSVYKAEPLDIQVIEDISAISDNEESMEISEVEDTQTILSKYIDGLELPVKSDIMKRFMLELYNEAVALEHVE